MSDMRISKSGLAWVIIAVSAMLFCGSLVRKSTALSPLSFHKQLRATEYKNKRVKTLNQPCDNLRETIAVCITGERRAFNKKIWNAILRNVRWNSTMSSCVHHFIVMDQPLGSGSPTSKTNDYWTQTIQSGAFVSKNSRLLQIHEIQHDFQNDNADAVHSEADLFTDAYDKSGYVNVSYLVEGGQVDKYQRCAKMVMDKEREQGWNYSYVFRVRPDALWYAPIPSYISPNDLKYQKDGEWRPPWVRSHVDTAWFAIRSAINISDFILWGPEVMLPWAHCRLPKTLGVYFIYVDNFLHNSAKTPVRFTSLCYRLYMMFGMPGNGQPPTDLEQFDFHEHVKAWFKSNETSGKLTGICSGLAPLLKSAPIVKHDVEACNYWGILPLRAREKIQEFEAWFPAIAAQTIQKHDEQHCQSLLTISCEALRELKFLLASAMNGPVVEEDNGCVPPSKSAAARYRKKGKTCKLLEMMRKTTRHASHGSLACYHSMLHDTGFHAVCTGSVSFDFSYHVGNDNSYTWYE